MKIPDFLHTMIHKAFSTSKMNAATNLLNFVKHLFSRGTCLMSLALTMQISVLVLSLAHIDPGFWPQTTPARLYANSATNIALIVVLALCRLVLHNFRNEEHQHRTAALVIAGMLWGLGAATAWGFDSGLGSSYFGCAGALFWSVNPRAQDPRRIFSR